MPICNLKNTYHVRKNLLFSIWNKTWENNVIIFLFLYSGYYKKKGKIYNGSYYERKGSIQNALISTVDDKMISRIIFWLWTLSYCTQFHAIPVMIWLQWYFWKISYFKIRAIFRNVKRSPNALITLWLESIYCFSEVPLILEKC